MSQFNNITEDLKSRIKPLGEKDIAVYELVGLAEVEQYDELTGARIKVVATPNSFQIPSRDRIMDTDGKWKDIAYIIAENSREINGNWVVQPTFGELKFVRDGRGMLTFHGDNPNHKEAYEYFELCNFNETSVNPKRTGVPSFKRLKPAEKAETAISRDRNVRKAKELLDAASLSELRQLSADLRLPFHEEQDMIIAALYEVAEKDYQKILNALSDEAFKLASLIKEAALEKVIAYENENLRWVWADTRTVICSYTPGSNNAEDSLLKFMQVSDESESIQRKLQNGVKMATEKKNSKRR